MAGEIRIKVDDSEVRRAVGALVKQVPFATALALTWTAKAARDYARAHVGEHVTMRGAFAKNQIGMISATKATQTSAVTSLEPIMAMLATGGDRPNDGGHDPMVPQLGRGLPRPTIKSKTPESKWARSLLAMQEPQTGASAYFVGKGGNVYRKTGKLQQRKRYHPGSGPMVRPKYPITIAWLKPKGKIHLTARWPLEAEVRGVVMREWSEQAAKAVQRALEKAWK